MSEDGANTAIGMLVIILVAIAAILFIEHLDISSTMKRTLQTLIVLAVVLPPVIPGFSEK